MNKYKIFFSFSSMLLAVAGAFALRSDANFGLVTSLYSSDGFTCTYAGYIVSTSVLVTGGGYRNQAQINTSNGLTIEYLYATSDCIRKVFLHP